VSISRGSVLNLRRLLIEVISIRTVERITKLHCHTILRLLVLAEERCIVLVDTRMHNLQCKRIQADEIWSFIAKKGVQRESR
jgi:hypothetical protein